MAARGGAEHVDTALVGVDDGVGEVRGGHRRIRVRFGKISRGGVDELRQRAGAHAHHRAAAGHGFEHHEAEGFVRAGVHERIGRGEVAGQRPVVAAVGNARDVAFTARFAAADHQQVIGAAEPAESLQQHGNVLLLREAPGKHEDARAARQVELGGEVASALVRAEGVDVHAQRVAGGMFDADAVQVVAHVAAGRQHLFTTLIRELHIPLDEPLHGLAEPPARELRKIRMVEGDERNTAAIRDVCGGPGRMECVADLDEIGLERVDGARPAHGVQRQAIVERAGHESAGNRRDVAGHVRAALSGDDEAVTPAGMSAHPLVLREQVSLYSTAGG